MALDDVDTAAPPAASAVFGARLPLAERYVDLLARHGVERGLIGPREVDRLWDRHVLNSAVLSERVPVNARVVDVGSGAGLPGVPLAIARPDLDIVLLEPMARRVDWLAEVAATLDLSVVVLRGRAEERAVRSRLAGADVVTARAVAPLARLAMWCLPLLRPSGVLLALKGATAAEEVARDRDAVRRVGGSTPTVLRCGTDLLVTPTTVVEIHRVGHRKQKER
ncbi:16S rRNA (guanine527-N7)-methyltransferase [Amycolatopsis arida]|uniref:Ribosomal RNA small subunit methyltransferase G n=1 Tax=Amycolatopsis arida TaxID=587909 RepID=A0A1I5TS47_9PSEU|nr:16S rRNA (guanine(527)-N(7))-methyltransferase RsmG [Amycolatopsis arida]TDX95989.1 16S rRNA (guanine527-N7)-methyltransferase [Amycolatopsis arida]SFP85884.1 16S rRNA (guanine527-N7)-methyltransferase [Amycolatopsis arida]